MLDPDPWQCDVINQLVTREENVVLNCSRQIGKTEVVAAAAYLVGCIGGFVLVLSPSDPQSKEFFERVVGYHDRLDLAKASKEPTVHEMRFASGGRILALPNNERTVRVYSAVSMLVVDEASRVPDQLYAAVRPMLKVSRGRTALLSTPFGQRGFFYRIWTGETTLKWRRHEHPWHHCRRLTQQDVDDERMELGDLWFAQEFECRFLANNSSVFDVEAFRGLVDPEIEVLTW